MATAREIFGRAIQKGLAVLGEPSLLGGQPCGNVAVQRGVQVFAGALDQANDNHVAQADGAVIEKQFAAKAGIKRRTGHKLNAYRCRWCAHWHLGHA